MKAIILAAGAAQRLRPYTDNTPKCLITVGPKTILENQLDAIRSVGIKEVIIVVGYLKEQIISFARKKYPDLNFKFITNADYASTNTIYSLWLTREDMLQDDFIYFNADVIFHPEILVRLLGNDFPSALAVDKKRCAEEEVKVIVNGKGRITDIGKELDTSVAAGEFIGVARFGKSINPVFVEKLEEAVQAKNVQAFFELALQNMADLVELFEVDVSDVPCIEIDFPEDLETARNVIYPQMSEFGILGLDEVAAAGSDQ